MTCVTVAYVYYLVKRNIFFITSTEFHLNKRIFSLFLLTVSKVFLPQRRKDFTQRIYKICALCVKTLRPCGE
jgi:hypothetical protein